MLWYGTRAAFNANIWGKKFRRFRGKIRTEQQKRGRLKRPSTKVDGKTSIDFWSEKNRAQLSPSENPTRGVN